MRDSAAWPQPKARLRLSYPDALRGIAALWVFLYHLREGKHIPALVSVLPDWFVTTVFGAGHLGVPVFFVLSGYVMSLTTGRGGLSVGDAMRFMVKRLVRISPPYYFAIVFACLFMLIKQHAVKKGVDMPDASSIVHHLFYLQGLAGIKQINIVFWTLCIEMQFYLAFAVFGIALGWAKADEHKVTAAWLALACVALFWPWFLADMPGDVLFVRYWYAFLMGVLVCRFGSAASSPGLNNLIILYIVAVLSMGVFMQDTFAMTSSAVAFSLVGAHTLGRMSHWLDWMPLQKMGLISYSVYLLHNPVTGAVSNIVHGRLGWSAPVDLLVLLSSFIGVLIVAALAYQFVEVPSISLAKTVFRRPQAAHGRMAPGP